MTLAIFVILTPLRVAMPVIARRYNFDMAAAAAPAAALAAMMADVTAAVAAVFAADIADVAADCDGVDEAIAKTLADAMPMPIKVMLRFDDEPKCAESGG